MIKYAYFIFLFFLGVQGLQAQIEDIDLDSMETMGEKDELTFRDSETGILNKEFKVSQDESRLSLIYHFNKDAASFTGIQGFEGIFAKKFSGQWFEFYGLIMKARYAEIFTASETSIEQNESSDNMKAFGVSYAIHDDWCQELLQSKSIFTVTSAGIGYYLYDNQFTNQSFSGLGFKADFGLHYRNSESFHYGFKMSYHLAPMSRSPEFEGESSSARSLTASWLSLALDISLYF